MNDSSDWKNFCQMAFLFGNAGLFLAWFIGKLAIEVFAKVKP